MTRLDLNTKVLVIFAKFFSAGWCAEAGSELLIFVTE
jgi:hypothetical protein